MLPFQHITLRSADIPQQLALLYICILYRPRFSPEVVGGSSRPLNFWQWTSYSQYLEFLAGLMYALFLRCARSTDRVLQTLSSDPLPHIRTLRLFRWCPWICRPRPGKHVAYTPIDQQLSAKVPIRIPHVDFDRMGRWRWFQVRDLLLN